MTDTADTGGHPPTGGATPSSTSSTCGRSPTPTATASATCDGVDRAAGPPGLASASTRSGSTRATRRPTATAATTSPTTPTSTPVYGGLPRLRALARRGPRTRAARADGPRPQPLLVEHPWFAGALAPAPGSPARARFHLPRRPRDRRRRAAEQLAVHLRRPGLDPRRPTAPSGTCTASTPSQPDFNWRQPGGRRAIRRRTAVLVRPRRRRVPHRRRLRHGQAPGLPD